MRLRTALLSLALAAGAPMAHAGPEAERVIETAAGDLVAGHLTQERIDMLVDAPRIARFALGKHVRTLAPEEVSRFAAAFDRFVDMTLADHASRFAGAEIEVLGSVDRSARDSIVTTRVNLPGETPQTVRWRVIDVGGAWRIVDVEAFGLWLAIEQRAQLAAILDRRGARIEDAIAALGRDGRDFAEMDTTPAS